MGVHTQTETEKSRDFLPAFTHKEKFTLTGKKSVRLGENRELRMPEIDLKVGPKPLDSPHTRAIHGAI